MTALGHKSGFITKEIKQKWKPTDYQLTVENNKKIKPKKTRRIEPGIFLEPLLGGSGVT